MYFIIAAAVLAAGFICKWGLDDISTQVKRVADELEFRRQAERGGEQ